MWRTGYDDEWKRRKEYLIRSLFEEVSLLSPVAEAVESSSDVSLTIRKSSDLLPSTVQSRPYSPLPALIIEKEPNRHDEPTEHYKRLELKMLRLYRRLFIEGRSVTSSMLMSDDDSRSVGSQDQNSDEEMQTIVSQRMDHETNYSGHEFNINNNLHLEEEENDTKSSLNDISVSHRSDSDLDMNVLQKLPDSISEEVESRDNHIESSKIEGVNTTRDVGFDIDPESFEKQHDTLTSLRIHEPEQQDEYNIRYINTSDANKHENVIPNRNRITEKYAKSSSSISSTEYVQKVTFQAEVHREVSEEDVESQRESNEESESNVSSHVLGDNPCESRMSLLENVEEEQVPESDKESAVEGSASEEREDVEIMRTPRLNPSIGSIQNEYAEFDITNLSTQRRKTRMRLQESYSSSEIFGDKTNFMNIDRCSDDFSNILQSSTPKKNRKRRTSEKSSVNNDCRRVIHRVSNKRRKCEDAAVQVSDNMSWSSLRHHLFVGTPQIFRLCSCKNHLCCC